MHQAANEKTRASNNHNARKMSVIVIFFLGIFEITCYPVIQLTSNENIQSYKITAKEVNIMLLISSYLTSSIQKS